MTLILSAAQTEEVMPTGNKKEVIELNAALGYPSNRSRRVPKRGGPVTSGAPMPPSRAAGGKYAVV
jgi:hypothetical protein